MLDCNIVVIDDDNITLELLQVVLEEVTSGTITSFEDGAAGAEFPFKLPVAVGAYRDSPCTGTLRPGPGLPVELGLLAVRDRGMPSGSGIAAPVNLNTGMVGAPAAASPRPPCAGRGSACDPSTWSSMSLGAP